MRTLVGTRGTRPVPAVDAPRAGPMSVRRVLALLGALASPEAPRSLAQLSAALDAPKPSLLSLLNELAALGYVRRVEHGFELGALAYRLGLQIVAVDSLSGAVRAALLDLNARLKMTVAFGYLDRKTHSLVYADRCEANGPVRYVVPLGTPLALHSRALGRLLLSGEPEADWPAWLGPEPYPAYTRQTLTRFARLRPILRRIRNKAAAITLSEQHEGIGSCAMPVIGADGQVAGGIATQSLSAALQAHETIVFSAMRATADQLSTALSARGITRDSLPQHL